MPHMTIPSLACAGRALTLAAALTLGACASGGDFGLGLGSSETSSADAAPGPQSDLDKATAYWGKKAQENPADSKATINYVRNLKALGRKQDALAAIQAGYLFNGENKEYLSEYGRLALDAGQVNLAAQLLERADDPAKPDWRVLSARGTVLAKQGEYKNSIAYFERARELAPGQASVLNNLAMAYTMDGQADRAEELLRQAQGQGSSDPRVQQNLALVLSLQGKSAEAKALGGEGAPNFDVPEPQPHITVQKSAKATAKAGKNDAFSPAAGAVANASASAPVTQVTATSLEPDEIMKAAMKAEEAKKKAEAKTDPSSKKRKQTVASADDVPGLKGSTP